MRYEPDHLKEKQAYYAQKDKWYGRIFIGTLLLLEALYLYALHGFVKTTLGAIGIACGAVVLFLLYTFAIMLLENRIGCRFGQEMNTAVQRYHQHKDGTRFLHDLLAIQHAPTSMLAEIMWYLNVSTALIEQGKKEEGTALIEQLEAVSTGKALEAVQTQLRLLDNEHGIEQV